MISLTDELIVLGGFFFNVSCKISLLISALAAAALSSAGEETFKTCCAPGH